MILFKLLSHLLDYPDPEMHRHLAELENDVQTDIPIKPEEQQVLLQCLRWMQARPLLELQENYVQTFDLTAENSLHLTHHTMGEDRARGPALIELDEHYKETGLAPNKRRELPDYLPLILEYVSTLDALQARWFLGQMKGVLKQLATRLEQAKSPYGPLLRLVETRAQLIPKDPSTAMASA